MPIVVAGLLNSFLILLIVINNAVRKIGEMNSFGGYVYVSTFLNSPFQKLPLHELKSLSHIL
jgi:hypothetical protein